MNMFQALIMSAVLGVILVAIPTTVSAGYILVIMDNTKPNGKLWDWRGGAPDPYIMVDGKSYRADKCRNLYRCLFQIPETGTIKVEVWDADIILDDSAGECTIKVNSRCNTGKGALVSYVSKRTNLKQKLPVVKARSGFEAFIYMILNWLKSMFWFL